MIYLILSSITKTFYIKHIGRLKFNAKSLRTYEPGGFIVCLSKGGLWKKLDVKSVGLTPISLRYPYPDGDVLPE